VVGTLLEIRSDTVGEYCSFPDVNDVLVLVLEQVAAGTLWQMGEFGL
jgi:hypothetical protein